MKSKTIKHLFIDVMPQVLEEGILYIYLKRRMCVHSCFCGCGNKVIISLNPETWYMIFNGENISIRPSIGNINIPCLSHYYITNNKVEWLPKMRKPIKRGFLNYIQNK